MNGPYDVGRSVDCCFKAVPHQLYNTPDLHIGVRVSAVASGGSWYVSLGGGASVNLKAKLVNLQKSCKIRISKREALLVDPSGSIKIGSH